ncbi:hypothetical protein CK203_104573 [Vitis vinifera]|uniref:Uncharacterized protein n=1 Tax=Vitis vinifera TaxID=29760 RepID=A0A438D3H1_VITVI|nr:hypothetical protein CK203_104573 [Vitis vinifera]
MGRGDEVSKDHNAPRMGSTKMPNVREGRTTRCPPSQPKANTPKTSLLSRAQVNEAKGERTEVAHTHMDKVTKGKVNLMGKRKQHSKHRKCKGLHPFEAS